MEKRNYNVDLFRITAAFLVIVLHVLGQGGILNSVVPNSINYWVAWFLIIGYMHICNFIRFLRQLD